LGIRGLLSSRQSRQVIALSTSRLLAAEAERFYTELTLLRIVGVDVWKEYVTLHAPNQKDRKVTLIAEDDSLAIGRGNYGKGTKAPFHSHEGEEYVHILRGSGVFRTRSGEALATEGMTLRFAPNEEHEFENQGDEPLEFIFVYSNPRDTAPLKENWVRC
jgi:quercetin dioxygenase-like cupin family protein